MKKKRPASQQNIDAVKPHCISCGSAVGQTSGRTMRRVKAVYDCPKCGVAIATSVAMRRPWTGSRSSDASIAAGSWRRCCDQYLTVARTTAQHEKK